LYNRNSGIGQAFRNITLVDTVEQIKIEGQYGISYRKIGKTVITGEPLAIKYFEDDSLYVKADTLVDVSDTSGIRRLSAFYNTKIYKSDMQGVSDSLIYSFTDSTISMLGLPILWTEENQITGDTLIVYRKNGELNRLEVIEEAFIVSVVQPEAFNQIDGTDMTAYFKSNKLSKVNVQGNGQSVYYVKEEDSTYTGVNHMVCSDMMIYVEDNTVADVRYYESPKGGFYPVTDFPADKKKLPNFVWFPAKRPTLAYFLGIQEEKEKERPDSVKDLFQTQEMIEE
jgi:lipopolysaccharide export system protein LptA